MFPGLLLLWALLSLWSPRFYSFCRFFYNIFTLPFLLNCVSDFHSLLYNLPHKQKHASPCQLCVQVPLHWAVSVSDSHFHIPRYSMPGEAAVSCLLLGLTHITQKMQQRKGSQTDHMNGLRCCPFLEPPRTTVNKLFPTVKITILPKAICRLNASPYQWCVSQN